jgi:hypothetical protein
MSGKPVSADSVFWLHGPMEPGNAKPSTLRRGALSWEKNTPAPFTKREKTRPSWKIPDSFAARSLQAGRLGLFALRKLVDCTTLMSLIAGYGIPLKNLPSIRTSYRWPCKPAPELVTAAKRSGTTKTIPFEGLSRVPVDSGDLDPRFNKSRPRSGVRSREYH